LLFLAGPPNSLSDLIEDCFTMHQLIVRPALLLTLELGVASAQEQTRFTRADSLRGTNSPARSWWDVTFYDLHVKISPNDSTISGWNGITYRVLRSANEMQIDLQAP